MRLVLEFRGDRVFRWNLSALFEISRSEWIDYSILSHTYTFLDSNWAFLNISFTRSKDNRKEDHKFKQLHPVPEEPEEILLDFTDEAPHFSLLTFSFFISVTINCRDFFAIFPNRDVSGSAVMRQKERIG